MREKRQATLAEVSGAVEIDTEALVDIEKGAQRPGEDILMLLISYFSVKEDDAVKIWELAGYDNHADMPASKEEALQPVLVMPMDARIVYTDMAHVANNQYGLTINFLQSDGIGDKPLAVSRVGMSREHALKLVKVLERALKPEAQKLLPAPKPSTQDEKN